MAGVNKVILVGRLGRDPEVRNFQNGGSVVNFSVATDETWKDKNGERQQRTEWHNVAIFNEKLGELAERYLAKGSQVYLEGQIQTRKWQDKDGNDRYSTEVVLPKFGGAMTFLGDAKGSGGGSEGGSERGSSSGRSSSSSSSSGSGGGGRAASGARTGGGWDSKKSDLDDEIPF